MENHVFYGHTLFLSILLRTYPRIHAGTIAEIHIYLQAFMKNPATPATHTPTSCPSFA